MPGIDDGRLIAALIAATGALLVSLIHALAGRRNSELIEQLRGELDDQRARLQSRLERDRQLTAEYLRHYLDFVVQGGESRLEAFRDLLVHVQAIRDRLRSVSKGMMVYDHQLLGEELQAMATKITESYATHQLHLEERDRLLAHSLKNSCVDLVPKVLSGISELEGHDQPDVPEIVQEDLATIASLQSRFRKRATDTARIVAESLRKKVEAEAQSESVKS